jgi:hypothetical protein
LSGHKQAAALCLVLSLKRKIPANLSQAKKDSGLIKSLRQQICTYKTLFLFLFLFDEEPTRVNGRVFVFLAIEDDAFENSRFAVALGAETRIFIFVGGGKESFFCSRES